VIAPTRFKDIYDQHFFALYSQFLADLATSRVLIVTGHSLRDDYLRAAIIERVRKKAFSLIVIAPQFPETLPAELRPARLGSAGEITHVPYKFEEFADDLASIIVDATPAEIADRCAEIVHHQRSRTKNKIGIKGNIGTLKPNSSKSFTAVIDAYIQPSDRPAVVRVWLQATLKTPDGREQNSLSGSFIESSPVLIAHGSGLVDTEIPIKFKVPECPEWAGVAKLELRVAIVKQSAQKPIQAKETQILASANRSLAYRT
jgi:hypothetical protein